MSVPMLYCEHGICIHFPTIANWRFSDCTAYKKLSGQGIKEMDLGWWDAENNTLWLVELKAFYNPDNPNHQAVDLATERQSASYWVGELYRKSLHSLCMVYSNRRSTQSCLPAGLSADHSLKMVYLLRPQPHQKSYLGFIQTELKTRLKEQVVLFDISSIAILDYEEELRHARLPWIVAAP